MTETVNRTASNSPLNTLLHVSLLSQSVTDANTGIDLAGILRGTHGPASAEGGSVPNGVVYGEGVPSPTN